MDPINLKQDNPRTPLTSITLPINHPLAIKLKEFCPEDKKFLSDYANLKEWAKDKRKELHSKGPTDERDRHLLELIDVIIATNPKDPPVEWPDILAELQNLQDGQLYTTTTQLKRAKKILNNPNGTRRLSFEGFKRFKEWLLEVDAIAINLPPYEPTLLEDPNAGHWDIAPKRSLEGVETITFELPRNQEGRAYTLIPRHPINQKDNASNTLEVAIDFGTKNTTTAILDRNSRKILLVIGTLDTKKAPETTDFENPTFMEFYDYQKFLRDYNALEQRPFTDINDLSISHMASDHFKEATGNDYYRFFCKLKQWAGSTGNEIQVQDNEGQPWPLGDLNDYGEGRPDPIEIYAYLLGRYINNMFDNSGGVYLNYTLSYPVKYEKERVKRIRLSFERGIKKSLPNGIFDPHISGRKEGEKPKFKKLSVVSRISEPVAYAISALQAFGFTFKNLNSPVNFAVFDFGGGTTDYDFGVWRKGKDEEDNRDYTLYHFGAGGNEYLGGENLLELLALEVFQDNMEEVRQKDLVIATPHYDSAQMRVYAMREFINEKREGRRNLQTIAESLRDFVHGLDDEQINAQELGQETYKFTSLATSKGDILKVEFSVNKDKLLGILKTQIGGAIKQFFHDLRAASTRMYEADHVHIFLGGNACRSPLVKMLFDQEGTRCKADTQKPLDFTIYPPLGTPEADAIIKERTGKDPEWDMQRRVTCKTGTVFGLLEARKDGGSVFVHPEDDVQAQDQAPCFKFHLGIKRGDCFACVLAKEDIQEGVWMPFITNFKGSKVDIYFTEKAQATAGDLEIEYSVKETVVLDDVYEESAYQIQIRRDSLDSIIVGVFEGGDSTGDEHSVHLKL
ncbi:hypothetical protein [Helicobacter salomonis]|uniref:hypothetical protein n=1 Tax=Helicobacter salomonis TaxID=56878 RepID=UPI0013154FDA|nr:hypothetical protein [Helicobacter salomonis]